MIRRCVMMCVMAGLCVSSAWAQPAKVSAGVSIWSNWWACGSTYKVGPASPSPTERWAKVSISAAGNEYEPFQLVLTSLKPLTGLKVTPHTLNGPNGATLPAWAITVRKVEYVNVSKPSDPMNGTQTGMYPDPLPELQPSTASKGIDRVFWVTVYVPAKTPAGDYNGVIDITADGGRESTVPVKLHVWGFTLPTVSKLRTTLGRSFDDPARYQGAQSLEQKRKLLDLYNTDSWRHRVSPVNPFAFYDIKVGMGQQVLNVDFTDFDVAIKKYGPLFNSFALPNFGATDSLGLDLGDEYERLKIEYMRTVAEHLIDKGQIGKGYTDLLLDPTKGNNSQMDDAIELYRKADGHIKVMVAGVADPKLIDSADIWMTSPGVSTDLEIKARQAKGVEVWWDLSSDATTPSLHNFIDSSAVSSRILPWLAWHDGISGVRYSNATDWRSNPYEKPMSVGSDGVTAIGNGAGVLIYPPVRKPSDKFVDKEPVPSMRWELIREGIEDYDYFQMLKERMEDVRKTNPSDPRIAKAEEALKLVADCAQSVTSYTQDPRKLHEARVKVAEAIEAL